MRGLLHQRKTRFGLHITSEWQFKLFGQAMQRHAFSHTDNRLHVRDTLRQRAVAMGAVGFAIKARLNNCLPERLVPHRYEPFFHIFKSLKALHAISISNSKGVAQIYGVIS